MIRLAILVSCWLAFSFTNGAAQSDSPTSRKPLPLVSNMAVPFYPPIARAANVEGTVHISVTTDGSKVTATHVEDGPKLLADGAEKNVRTWEFANRPATKFTVTYRFKLTKGSDRNDYDGGFIRETLVLHLPTELEILSPPNPPIDSSKARTQ